MGDHVFISYSRKDRAYAHRLADDLRGRGFEVWMDDRIDLGDRWWQTVDQAVRDCVALVVVMTPDAERSEWVEKEIMLAQREGKPILPLLLRGKQFSLLIDRQSADVTGDRLPPQAFYQRLRRALRAQGVPETPSPGQRDEGGGDLALSAEGRSVASVSGSGSIAQGGSQAAGQGGIAIGGDVHGDVVTGSKTTLFDQRGQHVERQINVAGDYDRLGRGIATPAEAGLAGGWNSAAIRDLLTAAFDDGELTTLCFDHFRPVYEDFSAGMSKGDKIQRLLEYCLRQGQVERLLDQVRERNPAQHARFAGRL